MTDVFEAFAQWAVHAVAAGGLVLFGGFLAVKLTRSAAKKRAAGGAAVAAALLAAVATAFPAWLVVPRPLRAESVPTVRRHPPLPPAALAFVPEARTSFAGPIDPDVAVDQLTPVEEAFVPPPVEDAAEPETPKPPPPTEWEQVAPLLGFVYAGFAAVFLGQLACGHVALARLRRSATPAAPAVQALFAELGRGIPFGPRVLVSRTVSGPLCFGVLRPTVLLPQALATHGSGEQLRWVLAHECEHLRRGDAWAGVLVALARAVFFPVPWFWAVRREMGLAQEYLADAAAAAAGGEKTQYAAFLVGLSAGPGRHPGPAMAARAKKSELFRRVSMLVQPNPGADRPAGKAWKLIAAGGLLATGVVMSGVGFADDKPAKGEKKTITLEATKAEGDGPVTVRVVEGEKPDARVEKLKAAVIEAANSGDAKKLAAAVDALAKAAAGPKAMTVTGRAIVVDDAHKLHAVPVPGVAGIAAGKPNVVMTRVVHLDDTVKELEKTAESLKKAAEKLKDQPEAVESLKKSIAELEKKIAEAKKKAADMPEAVRGKGRVAEIAPRAVQGVPLPPLPPIAPLPPDAPQIFQFKFNGQEMNKEAVEKLKNNAAKVMEGYKKQIAELKDNPEAEKALKQAMESYEKAIRAAVEAMAADAPQAFLLGGQFQGQGGAPLAWMSAGTPGQGRIGIIPVPVPDVLIAQLDVPNGEGVLIQDVVKGSAAEKAGLKANDVLLRVAGKPVPAAVEALPKMVQELPAGPADVVVLRKGKKETIKLDVPEKPKPAKAFSSTREKDSGPKFGMMSVSVNNEDFKIVAENDAAKYVVSGTVADGSAKPAAIAITPAGGKTQKFESLKDVPNEHRAAVEKLLKSVGK